MKHMKDPATFLKDKGIITSTDLDTPWNLNISRDRYVATVKEIVTAMAEYAEYVHIEKLNGNS